METPSPQPPLLEASRVDGVKGRRGRTLPLAVLIISTLALQLRFQARDLVLELAEHRVLRVFVDLGLVLDVLGSIRVSQRRHGLVVIIPRGAAVRAHDRLRISPQRILEQSC